MDYGTGATIIDGGIAMVDGALVEGANLVLYVDVHNRNSEEYLRMIGEHADRIRATGNWAKVTVVPRFVEEPGHWFWWGRLHNRRYIKRLQNRIDAKQRKANRQCLATGSPS